MSDSPSGWSLRRRLILISACGMTVALVFGGLAMFWAEGLEERQSIDARLEQLGNTLLSLVENGLGDRAAESLSAPTQPLKTRPASTMLYRYQVWSKDGVLVLRNHEAPSDRPIVDLKHLGFETVRIGGEDYRAFALPTKDNGVIQFAQCLDESSVQASTTTTYYAGFLLVPLGVVFLASWLLTRRSLRSIDSLAGELRRRNPLDVTHVDIESPPLELQPILNALDQLFNRVGHAISVERRFTSVAAHEMRTPLAGLRAQAQIAFTAQSGDESKRALSSLMQGVDRAAHMLDQLLDLARIEAISKDAAPPQETVDLAKVFRDVSDGLATRAAAKRISIDTRFEVPDLHGHQFGFHLILRNLLANAILYCPEGGRVEVTSALQGRDVILTVDDSGAGIAAADRDHAFERFNRLGQSRTDGVGLGLSIVLLIIELHGAKIELQDAPIGGLRVHMTFSQPPGAEPQARPAQLRAALQ